MLRELVGIQTLLPAPGQYFYIPMTLCHRLDASPPTQSVTGKKRKKIASVGTHCMVGSSLGLSTWHRAGKHPSQFHFSKHKIRSFIYIQ